MVPPEKLEEETMAFAGKLLSKSPLAVKLGKQFYYEMIDLPFRQRFEHSSNVFADLCTSEDAREGAEAFASKRKPVWRGR